MIDSSFETSFDVNYDEYTFRLFSFPIDRSISINRCRATPVWNVQYFSRQPNKFDRERLIYTSNSISSLVYFNRLKPQTIPS